MKECDATCANMIAYRAMYDKLEGKFEGCEVTHIGRESNEEADNLANVGSRCRPIPPRFFFEEKFERSVKIKPVTDPALATHSGARQASTATATEDLPKDAVMLVEATWTKPYLAYLMRGELPEDRIHRRQVMRRSKAFTIINGELYKRSTTGVLQRCIAQEDGIALLREIHEGTCGHHACSRTLIAKAFRSGFYWLGTLSSTAKHASYSPPSLMHLRPNCTPSLWLGPSHNGGSIKWGLSPNHPEEVILTC
jgi:hypothetical protein